MVTKKISKIFTPFLMFLLMMTLFGAYFVKNITSFIKRGVDLVGGTYITLDVDVNKVYESVVRETIKQIIKEDKLKEKPDKTIFSGCTVTLEYLSIEKAKEAYKTLKNFDTDVVFEIKENKINGFLPEVTKNSMADNAIESNIKTLRKRLDPYGAGEILIAKQGNRIVIELPNVQDRDQARRIIGKSAFLTIRPIIEESTDEKELLKNYKKYFDDVEICKSQDDNLWYVLPRHAEVTGSFLKGAHVGYNSEQGNRPIVAIVFNNIGKSKFHKLTKANKGKKLAIMIDDQVLMAPYVQDEINSAEASISSSSFTVASAQELASMLQSGSFAAPVIYAQERIIEPLLGSQTIERGLSACLLGLLLLFIASVLIYKTSGLIGFIVLVYNLIFSLIGIWIIGGTLTLSGIAGLILTIGMAVDASILIFERIRDELKKGNSYKVALENGFNGAMMVIIDANVTHFLVAAVLYYVGAGPIKGFAVTMIVGIIATILSGIFMFRSLFRWLIFKVGIDSIKI